MILKFQGFDLKWKRNGVKVGPWISPLAPHSPANCSYFGSIVNNIANSEIVFSSADTGSEVKSVEVKQINTNKTKTWIYLV